MATLAAVPTVMAVDIPEGGDGRAVSVEWTTGEHTSFNVLWLRDNCPSGGDKRSAFRTFSVAELDPDLTVLEAAERGGFVDLIPYVHSTLGSAHFYFGNYSSSE